ncbi:bifunctional phosphoribosylaminoimidazolecarboxamide formyltransferase/IMP cyclohydrolase [Lignipirellula cremea]|uniref:Bifunctional purine biosynthesis protein PurH n=1 Tax=Lignipirellula cremea TaxID=2528010 RepID=A0A518DTY7_9BACT|nr:bifunctional phosphoribosylaminoimidazolecarboxamide formyltransferase/IMP cyclohydrolase [Lignipirellula cremea]QDU95288.1 Bifunctional purine biosynthesis protein PurH [Lignipirellula cremea]
MTSPPIQRALISVSDKLGLLDFARGLTDAGVEIYSTGGTRRHLESGGIEVHDVSEYTQFPEMMDGRLKTLHPKIFGGILCRRDREDDMEAIEEHGISPFELVVVNLYPFEAAISRPETTLPQAVEQIDIGGPSLVRAAAKNFDFVTIATRPEQYSSILEELESDGCTSLELRRRLMTEAFAHTAAYDRVIADYFSGELRPSHFPTTLNLLMRQKTELRYGENPHQRAAVYREVGARGASLVTARQLNGKELSYNNLLDLDAALGIARSFSEPACAVIKHNNPCGGAVAATIGEACTNALAGDPLSAFGSVLGFNRTVDVETAEILSEPGLFIEAIVAPDFAAAAVGILTTRPKWKANVRLMQVGRIEEPPAPRHYRYIDGGMLVQDADVDPDLSVDWSVVTRSKPSDILLDELKFAWRICRTVKSNAIVLCKQRALCGVGAGQMSRVDSVEIAINKAGDKAHGSVLASDAFFPFPDSIERAAAAGVVAIIQPGGSRNDEEVIVACNKFNIPMIFTGRRHFRH